MKRIAIISPCILPVPASKGGAVEELITRIINDNEQYSQYNIDLFTIDGDASQVYSYTDIINLKYSKKSIFVDKQIDRYYRYFSRGDSKRTLDNLIKKQFKSRLSEIKGQYEAVVIENMMSTACEIVDLCNGKYDFPIYFHMHNDVDIYRSPKQIRKLVKNGIQFIAVSKYIKGQILKCSKDAVVSVLYNGVDLAKYNKQTHKKNQTKRLLYAGRIISGKGVKELVIAFIDALKYFSEEQKNNIRLEIVGFSGLDKKYEKRIRRIANRCSNIECINQVSSTNMFNVYNNADIVIMPTIDQEPFGMVALETMAMGIPLITTNSGALPEIVGDGAYIIDITHSFVRRLSESIRFITFNNDLCNLLSEEGYRRAHSIADFNIGDYYRKFCEIIKAEDITDLDKISVIIPIYNVKDYIVRCVKSIIQQTYTNLEIILVDDGSTDGSAELCDEISITDSRILVIHQENLGLSGARNSGIEYATGKYLFFCDGDDYLEYNALEMLLNNLKVQNADVVACGIDKVYIDEKHKEFERFTDCIVGKWNGHESIIQMMRHNNVCTVAWNKLYKADLFNEIRFPVNVKNEDEATIYKVLYNAKIVSYIPDTLYKYCQRDSSIMHETLEDRYVFYIQAIVERIAFFHEKGEDELEQHSRITLLEWIKYSYRNISKNEEKLELIELYKNSISFRNAPSVMGKRKQMALLLWKYFKY